MPGEEVVLASCVGADVFTAGLAVAVDAGSACRGPAEWTWTWTSGSALGSGVGGWLAALGFGLLPPKMEPKNREKAPGRGCAAGPGCGVATATGGVAACVGLTAGAGVA